MCTEDKEQKKFFSDELKDAIKDYDPNYGNWGGNNWSGGRYIEAGELGDTNVSATDSLDKLYKRHDIATYANDPDADSTLAIDLRRLPWNPNNWKNKPKNKVYAIIHRKLAETWFKD